MDPDFNIILTGGMIILVGLKIIQLFMDIILMIMMLVYQTKSISTELIIQIIVVILAPIAFMVKILF